METFLLIPHPKNSPVDNQRAYQYYKLPRVVKANRVYEMYESVEDKIWFEVYVNRHTSILLGIRITEGTFGMKLFS